MLRLLIILTIASCTIAAKLHVIYEWKYIDYVWESSMHKDRAISENKYNYTKIFTIDVQKLRDGRVFITTPAFNQGVPATLSTISERIGPGGPLLEPYPNWGWHNATNCMGITSVWRVAVDACDRLWVLDSGKVGEEQVCPAKLLVFNLLNDKLLRKIEIPDDISHNPQNRTVGLLINPIVEMEGSNCRRTWVYIADTEGGGLIIYDGSNFRRLNYDVFSPDPAASDFSIAGENFTLTDGLFGLALKPGRSSASRRLFFRPLASLQEYSFSTEDLHKSTYTNDRVRYTTSNYRLPSQVAAQAFSRDGILFLGMTREIAIACWNANTPLDDEHVVIVAQDDETLQFASGVKVTKSSNHPSKEELWVSTNRFQKIMAGTQNFEEINFRVLRGSVEKLVKNTKCQSRCKGDTWAH